MAPPCSSGDRVAPLRGAPAALDRRPLARGAARVMARRSGSPSAATRCASSRRKNGHGVGGAGRATAARPGPEALGGELRALPRRARADRRGAPARSSRSRVAGARRWSRRGVAGLLWLAARARCARRGALHAHDAGRRGQPARRVSRSRAVDPAEVEVVLSARRGGACCSRAARHAKAEVRLDALPRRSSAGAPSRRAAGT